MRPYGFPKTRRSVGADSRLLLDRLVQLGGLGQRCDAQLLLQDANALAVLTKGGVALVGPGVEPHDLTVRLLPQGIQRQPASGRRQRTSEVPTGTLAGRQLLQRLGQFPAQRFSLDELPVVELGAVAQGEASQEVVAVERSGFGQGRQARVTDIGGGMAVRPAGGQPRAELGHIHPEARAGDQADRVPIDDQMWRAQGRAERGERPAQGRHARARRRIPATAARPAPRGRGCGR